MSLFSKVVRAMRKIAPLELADQSWDNVGILVEPPYPSPKFNKVFLTIDLTPQVLEEALSDPKVGTIVSYHPPIFRAMKRLTQSDVKQDIVMKAIARGVGIYSPHTACDNCVNGVNDWLASGLGKGVVEPIIATENPPEGQENSGTGRLFVYDEPTSLGTVIARVKELTGLSHVRVATAEPHMQKGQDLIKTVAICAGSGSSVLNPVKADLYFSGEMGHHDVLAALAQDTSVILCEHSNTERGYLSAVLQPALQKALANESSEEGEAIEIIVSKLDKDPLQIV
ncbi:GTP cyclohydrolase 1 type 2/Nif3 [Radiomyces spectabilis]|uniref:GTP cyclohydrolase 1 type 2/Nif3 n=1 Tax=Radiomyces spectabilis TaxID=64574 RepID=UPI00221FFEED|nr:GTP cyclohydrolase 1 type 2/Nif3 [Radiomyces spectabilis]KAI8372876.1 GTP cyclohydrolase 1 type 2/Nif3 [Radiomyces spectabilis]